MSRAPRTPVPIAHASPAPVLAHYTLQAIAARIAAWRESPTSYEDSVDVIEDIDKLIRSAT